MLVSLDAEVALLLSLLQFVEANLGSCLARTTSDGEEAVSLIRKFAESRDGKEAPVSVSLENLDSGRLCRMDAAMTQPQLESLVDQFGWRIDHLRLLVLVLNIAWRHAELSVATISIQFWALFAARIQDARLFEMVEILSAGTATLAARIRSIIERKLGPALRCLRCQINTVGILFLPCGHMTLCPECHRAGTVSACLSCNTPILEQCPIFL